MQTAATSTNKLIFKVLTLGTSLACCKKELRSMADQVALSEPLQRLLSQRQMLVLMMLMV